MSTFNEINDNINELILQKSFDKLTPEEQAQAIAYAGSEEEYNQLRTTLLAITSSFNDETEEELAAAEVVDTKKDLMARFESKYGTQNNRVKVVPMYRKPMFQLAVAASLTLIVVFTFPLFNTKQQENGQLAQNKSFSETGEIAPAKDEAAALNMHTTDSQPVTVNEGYVSTAQETERSANSIMPVPEKEISSEGNGKKTEMLDEATALNQDTKYKNSPALENKKSAREDVTLAPPVQAENRLEEELSFSDASWHNLDLAKEKNAEKDGEFKKERARKSKEDVADRVTTGAAAQKANNAGLTVTGATTVSAFVETNKTEMIDLLFTVY